MNVKAVVPLVAGIGIAGLAAKLGFDYVKKAGAAPKMVQLWTPTQDVSRGTMIAESLLQPLSFPANAVPKGALTDPKKIVGRVPHTGAPAGLPLLDSMLLPPGARPGIRVPDGLRAAAVKVDESSGVDNHLQPGDRVDVIGYFSTRRDNKTQITARTILENVEVAAVGARISPDAPTPKESEEKSKSGKTNASKEKPARAVTLLVKPQQIPTLHLAEQRGKIKLAMRGVADESLGREHEFATEEGVLGLEPDAALAANSKGMSGLLSGLMSSFAAGKAQGSRVAPTPQPEPEPEAAPTPPEYDWFMVVMNGSEREVLGWRADSPMQAVSVTDEGPNLFQERRKGADGKRGKPVPPRSKPPELNPPGGTGPQAEPTPEEPVLPDDAPTGDPEQEEELFG